MVEMSHPYQIIFLIVPSKNYGIIEDFHLVLNHLVTASLKGKNNYINDI